MPDDLYGDGAPPAPPPSAPDAEPKQDSEGEEYPSVLIPKDVCSNEMKPGDEFKLKVEQVLEDQYSVKYVAEDENQEGAPPEPPAPPPGAGGMASLYE